MEWIEEKLHKCNCEKIKCNDPLILGSETTNSKK